jgi:hypothetical protein
VEPPKRTSDGRYRLVAAGGTVVALAVIAPLAIGAGIVAARLAGGQDAFAIVLVTAVAAGLLSGGLAAPALRRVVDRRAGLARAGAGRAGRRP